MIYNDYDDHKSKQTKKLRYQNLSISYLAAVTGPKEEEIRPKKKRNNFCINCSMMISDSSNKDDPVQIQRKHIFLEKAMKSKVSAQVKSDWIRRSIIRNEDQWL